MRRCGETLRQRAESDDPEGREHGVGQHRSPVSAARCHGCVAECRCRVAPELLQAVLWDGSRASGGILRPGLDAGSPVVVGWNNLLESHPGCGHETAERCQWASFAQIDPPPSLARPLIMLKREVHSPTVERIERNLRVLDGLLVAVTMARRSN